MKNLAIALLLLLCSTLAFAAPPGPSDSLTVFKNQVVQECDYVDEVLVCYPVIVNTLEYNVTGCAVTVDTETSVFVASCSNASVSSVSAPQSPGPVYTTTVTVDGNALFYNAPCVLTGTAPVRKGTRYTLDCR